MYNELVKKISEATTPFEPMGDEEQGKLPPPPTVTVEAGEYEVVERDNDQDGWYYTDEVVTLTEPTKGLEIEEEIWVGDWVANVQLPDGKTIQVSHSKLMGRT